MASVKAWPHQRVVRDRQSPQEPPASVHFALRLSRVQWPCLTAQGQADSRIRESRMRRKPHKVFCFVELPDVVSVGLSENCCLEQSNFCFTRAFHFVIKALAQFELRCNFFKLLAKSLFVPRSCTVYNLCVPQELSQHAALQPTLWISKASTASQPWHHTEQCLSCL